MGELLTRLLVVKQVLQLLAEGRDVTQRAFQGDQCFAQRQQLVQLGHLARDPVRPEIVDGPELQVDGQLGIRGGASLDGTVTSRLTLASFNTLLNVCLSMRMT